MFGIAPWSDPGSFTNGDSFLVLSCTKPGASGFIKKDLFIWIGGKSTIDEAGVAAKKMTELSDALGVGVHHREIQDHESPLFHSAFAPFGGIRVLDGDFPSGFNPVTIAADAKLYKVKGAKQPVLMQVKVSGLSLNQGDAFLYVSPTEIFLWLGAGANPKEKMKASTVSDYYKGINKGAKFVRLENGETTADFWKALGGQTAIAPADASDAAVEAENVKKVYSVSPAGGFTLIAEGAKATSALLKSDLFVVQRGESVVVFLGKNAPAPAKAAPLKVAEDFLKAQKQPEWLSVVVAKEGIPQDDLDVIFL